MTTPTCLPTRTPARRAAAVAALVLALAGPTGALVTAEPAAAAVPEHSTSPTVSPRAWNGAMDCPTGYLCAYVLTNGGSHDHYDEFRFYHCRTYALSYWKSWGIVNSAQVVDNQTGGVTTTLYDQASRELQRLRPDRNKLQPVLSGRGGWDQVYSIRVC